MPIRFSFGISNVDFWHFIFFILFLFSFRLIILYFLFNHFITKPIALYRLLHYLSTLLLIHNYLFWFLVYYWNWLITVICLWLLCLLLLLLGMLWFKWHYFVLQLTLHLYEVSKFLNEHKTLALNNRELFFTKFVFFHSFEQDEVDAWLW